MIKLKSNRYPVVDYEEEKNKINIIIETTALQTVVVLDEQGFLK